MAKSENERQKAIELASTEAVARVIGCKAIAEDEANPWPDGWMEHPHGDREPVEVVAAFRRPANEDPKRGSYWLRHWKRGDRAALALAEASGEAVSFYVHDDGFMVLDGNSALPLAMEPTNQNEWVIHALHQKVAKNYASGTPAILVVQLCSPLPLTRFAAVSSATTARRRSRSRREPRGSRGAAAVALA